MHYRKWNFKNFWIKFLKDISGIMDMKSAENFSQGWEKTIAGMSRSIVGTEIRRVFLVRMSYIRHTMSRYERQKLVQKIRRKIPGKICFLKIFVLEKLCKEGSWYQIQMFFFFRTNFKFHWKHTAHWIRILRIQVTKIMHFF